MVHFLYQLGVRPRMEDDSRVNLVVRFPPRDLNKLRYALSLGYHESVNEETRRNKMAQVVATSTNIKLFETALAGVGANYYYTIPVWLRLYYTRFYEVLTISPELLPRIIARGKTCNRGKIGSATTQDVHRLLDEVTDIHSGFMDTNHTMRDVSWKRSVKREYQICHMHQGWKLLVSIIRSLSSEELPVRYPDGTKTSVGSLQRCYCPDMRWIWHDALIDALETWLDRAHLCGLDTAAYRDRIISLFEMYVLESRRPWDCRWCRWCRWCLVPLV